jgi:hypothetical protein
MEALLDIERQKCYLSVLEEHLKVLAEEVRFECYQSERFRNILKIYNK